MRQLDQSIDREFVYVCQGRKNCFYFDLILEIPGIPAAGSTKSTSEWHNDVEKRYIVCTIITLINFL